MIITPSLIPIKNPKLTMIITFSTTIIVVLILKTTMITLWMDRSTYCNLDYQYIKSYACSQFDNLFLDIYPDTHTDRLLMK